MSQIGVKVLKIYDWKPIRNQDGKITHVHIKKHRYSLKYFSKQAKDYIFSIHPIELSSLEKELL